MLRSCPSQLLVPRSRKAEHTEKAIRLVLEEKNQLGVLSSISNCLGDLSFTLADDQLLRNNYST